MKIKLIIFDAGDILFDFRGSFDVFIKKLRKLFEEGGAKLPEGRDYWDEEDIGPSVERGLIDLKEARRRHLRRLGLSENLLDRYEEIERESFETTKLTEPDIRNVLLRLKKTGYRIAVLSDTVHNKDMLEFRLGCVGLDGLFDELFSSSEIKYRKPEKEAYFTVLNHFGVSPKESVFVAHDEDELVGAKKIGITTISYQGHESGDFKIKKFAEILNVLEKLK